jgi:protein-S-isoprenylcysteine O-methyltransferase Ste14
MGTVLFQAVGVILFLSGSAWLGRRVRRVNDGVSAKRYSRMSHLLFWTCLMLPGFVGFLHPGLTGYDDLFGVPPLPSRPLTLVLGWTLLVVGIGLMVAANHALARLGRGTAALLLTQTVVSEGIYRRTRNPMSLGFYMACVGVGLVAGSTTVTLAALVVIVPVHLFNLSYFEERELAVRYGKAYLEYRARTPFLVPRLQRRGR